MSEGNVITLAELGGSDDDGLGVSFQSEPAAPASSDTAELVSLRAEQAKLLKVLEAAEAHCRAPAGGETARETLEVLKVACADCRREALVERQPTIEWPA